MKKNKVTKILFGISVILVITFVVATIIDYARYSTTLNSAPFYVFVLFNAIMYGIPSLICAVIGLILEKKGERNKNILDILKENVADKKCLDELISAFEDMCKVHIEAENKHEKMILFETGTFSFSGNPMFYMSLVRQYPNEEDEFYQLHLDIMYEPTSENSVYEQATWSFELEENIFEYIRSSEEYMLLKDVTITKIDVYIDET